MFHIVSSNRSSCSPRSAIVSASAMSPRWYAPVAARRAVAPAAMRKASRVSTTQSAEPSSVSRSPRYHSSAWRAARRDGGGRRRTRPGGRRRQRAGTHARRCRRAARQPARSRRRHARHRVANRRSRAAFEPTTRPPANCAGPTRHRCRTTAQRAGRHGEPDAAHEREQVEHGARPGAQGREVDAATVDQGSKPPRQRTTMSADRLTGNRAHRRHRLGVSSPLGIAAASAPVARRLSSSPCSAVSAWR